MNAEQRIGAKILGSFMDACDWPDVLAIVRKWAVARESRYVCICNVHSVVTASSDHRFRDVLNQADLATPDGAPVAWMLRRLGFKRQQRINGPDLMWRYCAQAQGARESIFLYGGSPETLERLEKRLKQAFPALTIAGSYSPPYRPLTDAEDQEVVRRINASGAGVVWVSLGCPKQEIWMADHRGRISTVMIGVGAAFDYHAHTIRRAPLWMQRGGLEWLHRLCSEPRRLWKRYLITNTLFVVGATRQLLGKMSRP
jgi:N-acetylglucosaminyldiphosphoundecaprenol N-acetyl-beta-D-mannosaminyltransferase